MNKYFEKTAGFTLIEIMVSLVISSLVIAGVYGVYTIQQRSYTVQEQVSEMQQRIRAAVDFMSREIRMAGYNPPDPYDPGDKCAEAKISTAETKRFEFSYCEIEKNGESYSPSFIENEYTFYDANDDNGGKPDAIGVLRKKDGSSGDKKPIVEGVEAIEFRYLSIEIDSVTKKPEVKVLEAPVADPSTIRAVQISMLVRSTYPDPKYTNTTVYKPASVIAAEKADPPVLVPTWDINGDEPGAGNPPNDNFHRRLLITTIYLRNMGIQE